MEPEVPPGGYLVPTPTPVPGRARSLRMPAGLVVAALGLNIVLAMVDLVLTPLATSRRLNGADPSDLIVLGAALLGLAQVGAFIITAAAFITWLYQARKNLETWLIHGVAWSPGWAIGGWFIPLANLVIAPMVVNAVVRGSETPAHDRLSPNGSSGLVVAWWLVYVCSGVSVNISTRKQFRATDEIAYIAGYNSLNTLLYLAAAVLAIVLVRRVTGLQERRQQALDHGWQQALFPQG